MKEEVDCDLALAVQLVLYSLRRVRNQKLVVSEHNHCSSTLIQLTIDGDDDALKFQLVAVEVEPKTKCLVSLCKEDDCVGQRVLVYKDDLKMEVEEKEYPIDFDDYIHNVPELDKIVTTISTKLAVSELQEHEKSQNRVASTTLQSTVPKPLEPTQPSTFPLSSLPEIPVGGKTLPENIPQFDDEYEVNRKIKLNQENQSLPSKIGAYGDKDLYPTGQSHPNWNNPPGANIDMEGGMVFDPLRATARRKSDKPPGVPEGAKYDDPFGGPSAGFIAPGFPGPGPGFSGSGGFF